jgi:DNA primase catalytic subunit
MDELTYLDFDTFEFSIDAEEELKMILARNSTEFQEVITKLTEANIALSKTKESLNQAINTSTWNELFEKVKKDYSDLQEELNLEELNDLGNIEALSNLLIIKESELADIVKDERELESLSEDLNELFVTFKIWAPSTAPYSTIFLTLVNYKKFMNTI